MANANLAKTDILSEDKDLVDEMLMGGLDPRIYYLDKKEKCYIMHPHIQEQYRKIMSKQLEEWGKGNPLHSNQLGPGFELPEGIDGECCPDFSCCQKELEWDENKKKIFIEASNSGNKELVNQLLMGSLGSLISTMPNKEKTYIAGMINTNQVHH